MTKKKGNNNVTSKPLLELVMIVKNAEGVITNTLKACKPYIDYYTILDTGSTDNTVEVIKEVMKDAKGNIYQEPFIDFSTSRNRVLDLAGERCKYTMMLDDTYILENGEELRKELKQNNKDAFDIRIIDSVQKHFYFSTRILATKYKYRYIYRVHEIPKIPHPGFQLSKAQLIDDNVTTAQRSKNRYYQDISNLQKDLEDYPNDIRILFHLAGTYTILNNYKEAKRIYTLIIKICKDKSEGNEILYHSYYKLGILTYRKSDDNWKKAEHYFISAYNLMKFRAEPLYHIAGYYYRTGEMEKAYNILEKAIKLKIPMNMDYDVSADIYLMKIPYLYLETSIILKKCEFDQNLYERLNNLVEENKNVSHFYNIREMLFPSPARSILRYNAGKTLVFHLDFSFGIWNPQNFSENQYVSGSEIIPVYLSQELTKLGYKIFIFSHFINESQNNECIKDGITFLDISKYLDWISSHYIDYLVVSRNPCNIYYLSNISQVYLWVHDILPVFEYIQGHRTKFNSILTLCNWHKNEVFKEYNVPIDRIKVTRNAIKLERFQKEVEKVQHRFIWTSSPDRGLRFLLQLFPKIREKYSDATLYIFCNEKVLSEDDKKIINMYDYIYLSPRVSQDQLAIEYLKSDVWLYPTDFQETYCITAVEAQMAGCLCVTLNIGSLSEIVGERGIVIKGEINNIKVQENLLQKLFDIMDNENLKNEYKNRAKEWATNQSFVELAKEWKEQFLN